MSKVSKTNQVLVYVVLLSYTAIVMIPMFWMFFSSLKDQADLVANPIGAPTVWHWENYIAAWKASKMAQYFLNSVAIILIVHVVCIGSASMIAFALSRFEFKGSRFWYTFFLAGLVVPVHSVIIPVYDIAIRLGAINNHFYLAFVYSAFLLPLSMVIIYSFMAGIPHEIEESAVMDGCGPWGIYARLLVPMSREGFISAMILTGLNVWNGILLPLVLLNRQEMKTVAIGLLQFRSEHDSLPTELIAAGVIAMIPLLLLYAFLQERIVKGLTMGAVKG